ncbi:MAG: hypothetical protein MK085_01120 [Phycisphaerales bacterium]|nr:hypothetical protein [Phycisphaerales bacterium]
MPPHARRLLSFLAMVLILPAGVALAQEAPSGTTSESASDPPSVVNPPTRRRVAPDGQVAEVRPPLLREGGYLVREPGEINVNAILGVHEFQPLKVEDGGIRRRLILLPSRAMDDLVKLLRMDSNNGPAATHVFELSGKVLVYRGRNFLLPDSVVQLEEPVKRVEAELKPDAIGAAPRFEEVPLEGELDDSDGLVDAIEARLEARIGAVPRSVDIAARSDTRANSLRLRAGSRLQDRRGHLLRDPSSGTWRFVFDGSDIAPELLPCQELERMERKTRSSAVPTPVLVSGVVTAFQGRNYLLPTAFRVAREGRGIGP